MPKVASSYVPKYRRHAATDQARVEIDGRTFYLGPWKSKASLVEYDRIINEWLANGRRLPSDGGEQNQGIHLIELLVGYRKFARRYYRKNGKVTREAGCIEDALDYLRRLYARTPAAEFGPRKLKAVRQAMIDAGLTRRYINKQVGRIVRMFKWAVAEELVPGDVYHSLQALDGLRVGRTDAKESAPVLPVDQVTVDDTLPELPAAVADMVRFQRLTGARPGEVCVLRPIDVDRSGPVWAYRPESHKTEHQGRERVIFIGPKAQETLLPYLLRPETEYCFQPRESESKRRQLAHDARKTPMSCGNKPGSNRVSKPKRSAGQCYTNGSYRRAIHRAVHRINDHRAKSKEPPLPKWSPNQLRHAAATEIRKRFGLEAAQVCLGHSQADITQVYAERDMQRAAQVMQEVG